MYLQRIRRLKYLVCGLVLRAILCVQIAQIFGTLVVHSFQTSNQNSDLQIPVEVPSLRTETSKTFKVEDKTRPLGYKFITRSSTSRLHYQSLGKWLDIDNSIVYSLDSGFDYENKANDFKVYFSSDLTKGLRFVGAGIDFRVEKIVVDDQVLVQHGIVVINENKIVYPDVLPSVDLEFDVVPEGIEKKIILKSTEALNYKFETVKFYTSEGNLLSQKNNQINFQNNSGVFLTKSVTTDANGQVIEENVSLDKSVVSIIPNQSFLRSSQRVFPVVIDPGIEVKTPTEDTFVSSTATTVQYTKKPRVVGNYQETTVVGSPWYMNSRSFLKFAGPQGGVVSAKLTVFHYGSTGGSFTTGVYRVSGDDFSESGTNWSNQPGFGQKYSDMVFPSYNSNSIAVPRSSGDISALINAQLGSGRVTIGLKSLNESQYKGVVYCQKNTALAPCKSQATSAVLEYESNYPPATPVSISPDNFSDLLGNCDESARPVIGTCRSHLNIGFKVGNIQDGEHLSGDPANYSYAKIAVSGNNQNFVDLGGYEGGQGYYGERILTRGIGDGNYYWGAKLKDQYELESNLSSTKQFTVDTVPPTVPVLNLPEFSIGNQIEFSINSSSDNISSSNNIAYFIQVSDTDIFQNIVFAGWQNANTLFQIPNLNGGQKYFYRVKSRDRLTNNSPYSGNVSDWSQVAYSTQDDTLPVISNVNLSKVRFSPKISASTEVSFDFDEKNFASSFLEIENAKSGKIVRSLKKCSWDNIQNQAYLDSCSVNNLTKLNSNLEHGRLKFVWDGLDDVGNIAEDGAYIIRIKVLDKAGNINDQALINAKQITILDSSGANIVISMPKNGSFTNKDIVEISGSVAGLNQDNFQDKDFTKLEIKSDLDSGFRDITSFVDKSNNFSTSEKVFEGENSFQLRTTDLADNQIDKIGQDKFFTINKDIDSPKIIQILPQGLLNIGEQNKNPKIEFSLNDEKFLNSKDIGSGFYTGINPAGYDISLLRDLKNDGNWQELPLFRDGTNVTSGSPKLGGDLVCSILNPQTKVNCTLQITNLVPDGKYRIYLKVRDRAGNYTCSQSSSLYSRLNPDIKCKETGTFFTGKADLIENIQTEFILDTHTFVSSSLPVDNATYSASLLDFKGQGEMDSKLEIINYELDRRMEIYLNTTNSDKLPAEYILSTGQKIADTGLNSSERIFTLENIKITCGKFSDIDQNPDTKEVEMCDFSTKLKQKNNFSGSTTAVKPLYKSNNNTLKVTDQAGNTQSITKTLNIDVYSLTLTSKPDIVYFSPNGDGRQDGINFENSVGNMQNTLDTVQVKSYSLNIYSSLGNMVRQITEQGSLPSLISFDGKNNDGKWLEDGNYKVVLEVFSSDNVNVKTSEAEVFARTSVAGSPIITSPKTGFVTTRGILNIQGQAEFGEGNFVKVCIDDLSTSTIGCDFTEVAKINEKSFFSTIALLPLSDGKTVGNYIIYGILVDKFGSQSSRSNEVAVVLDTSDIFKNVEIVASFRELNSQQEIDDFLAGKLNINQIKNLQLRTLVKQNTEALALDFAEYINMSELPNTASNGYGDIFHADGHIATLNDESQTDRRLNPYLDIRVKKDHTPTPAKDLGYEKKCTQTECSWFYNYPVPSWISGGKYEIRFRGYKGESIQDISRSVAFDGRRASAPKVLLVQKESEGVMVSASEFESKYYTNSKLIKIIGVADPNSKVEMSYINKNGEVVFIPALNAESTGKFEISLELPDKDFEYIFTTSSILGESKVENKEKVSIILDRSTPVLQYVQTAVPEKGLNPWVWTGDRVDFEVKITKKIAQVEVAGMDTFITNSFTSDNQIFRSSLNINQKEEGIYYPKIKLTDFAGNIGTYTNDKSDISSIFLSSSPSSSLGKNYPYSTQHRGKSLDFRLFIDNTRPDTTQINTQNWSDNQNGILADGNKPELDRLITNYVLRGNTVLLEGYAEKNQRVTLNVLRKNQSIQSLSQLAVSTECNEQNTQSDKVTSDRLVVKFTTLCKWSYLYTFDDNGSSPLGIPQTWYLFQASTFDLAGNQSEYSKSVTIYQDDEAPKNTAILNIFSSSYNPVINYPTKAITKDITINLDIIGERQADISLKYGKKSQQTSQKIFRNSPFGQTRVNLSLGQPFTDESKGDNCMVMSKTRRVGICSDGLYNIDMNLYDTAGNKGDTIIRVVERDTVAPVAPQFTLNKSGDIFGEFLNLEISGEKEAKARIKITTDFGFNFEKEDNLNSQGKLKNNNLFGQMKCGNKEYLVTVVLTDRAGNVSTETTKKMSTGECAMCGYGGVRGDGEFEKPLHNDNAYIAFPYGYSKQYQSSNVFHRGVDYNGILEGEPVYPASAGRVVKTVFKYTDFDKGLTNEKGMLVDTANYVMINHGSGMTSLYLHLQYENNSQIREGDWVDTNTVIGRVGNTGNSTGAHLHFELRKNNLAINPTKYLGKEKTNLTKTQFDKVCKKAGEGGKDDIEEWRYDNKTVDDLGELVLRYEKNWFKNGGHLKSVSIPSPILTRVVKDEVPAKNESGDGKFMYSVYGIGMTSKQRAKIEIYDGNKLLETKFEDIDTAKIFAYKDTLQLKDEDITNFENNDRNGRFKFNVWRKADYDARLDGARVFDTDEIYTRSRVEHKTSCFQGECQVDGGDKFFGRNESSKSNRVRIDRNLEVIPKFGEGIEEGFDVHGGDDTGMLRLGNTRSMQLRLSSADRGNTDKLYNLPVDANVWVVSHGWNDDDSNFSQIADDIKAQHPEDTVLLLNWSEGSNNGDPFDGGNCRASTWIKSTAQGVFDKITSVYKIKDYSKVKLVGHSLGSLMSTEISKRFGGKTSLLVALDPPSELSCFGKYEIDKGGEKRSDFAGNSQMSRSFVGRHSLAGNQDLAKTADKSFWMEFDSVSTNSKEHAWVVQTWEKMNRSDFLRSSYLSASDFDIHSGWQRNNDISGVYGDWGGRGWEGHSGVIEVGNPWKNGEKIQDGSVEWLWVKEDGQTKQIKKI